MEMHCSTCYSILRKHWSNREPFDNSFRSVVVITCALHAQGPRFEPGRKQYTILLNYGDNVFLVCGGIILCSSGTCLSKEDHGPRSSSSPGRTIL